MRYYLVCQEEIDRVWDRCITLGVVVPDVVTVDEMRKPQCNSGLGVYLVKYPWSKVKIKDEEILSW